MDTKRKVVDILGFDYDFFQSIFYLPQQKFLRFVSGTDSDRMGILTGMLGLLIYDKLSEKVKMDFADKESRRSELQNKMSVYQSVIQGVDIEKITKDYNSKKSELKSVQESLNKMDSAKKSISEREDELSDLKSDIEKNIQKDNTLETRKREIRKGYKEAKEKLEQVKKEVGEYEKPLQTLYTEREGQQKRQSNLIVELKHIKEEKKRYINLKDQGVCPTCLRTIKEGDLTHIGTEAGFVKMEEKISKELEKINGDLVASAIDMRELEKKRDKYNDAKITVEVTEKQVNQEVKKIEEEQRPLGEWLRVHDTEPEVIQKEIVNLRERQSVLETKIQNENDHIADISSSVSVMEERIKEYDKYSKEIDGVSKELGEVMQKEQIIQFWSDNLGDRGIKRFKTLQASAFLNDMINRNLELLTDGVMKVYFEPFSTNKKGEITKKFSLSITNGVVENLEFSDMSGGEKQLIALAVLLAFWKYVYESGLGCNILMLDEVLAALDEINRGKVCVLLEDLKFKQMGCSLLMVTHESEIRDTIAWDRVVDIEKVDGKSVVQEVI